MLHLFHLRHSSTRVEYPYHFISATTPPSDFCRTTFPSFTTHIGSWRLPIELARLRAYIALIWIYLSHLYQQHIPHGLLDSSTPIYHNLLPFSYRQCTNTYSPGVIFRGGFHTGNRHGFLGQRIGFGIDSTTCLRTFLGGIFLQAGWKRDWHTDHLVFSRDANYALHHLSMGNLIPLLLGRPHDSKQGYSWVTGG